MYLERSNCWNYYEEEQEEEEKISIVTLHNLTMKERLDREQLLYVKKMELT